MIALTTLPPLAAWIALGFTVTLLAGGYVWHRRAVQSGEAS